MQNHEMVGLESLLWAFDGSHNVESSFAYASSR